MEDGNHSLKSFESENQGSVQLRKLGKGFIVGLNSHSPHLVFIPFYGRKGMEKVDKEKFKQDENSESKV